MGEPAVGKSCLIKRFCEARFTQKHTPTIGIDYGVKPVQIGQTNLRVNFWDLAGPEQYKQVRTEFYKDAQGALLVFDVNSRDTYEALDKWLKEAREHGASNMVLAVCANKIDLGGRVISQGEARKWAVAHGAIYFETSAKDGTNVLEMFDSLFRDVHSSCAS